MNYVMVLRPEQAMKGRKRAYIQHDYKFLTFKCNYIRTEGIRRLGNNLCAAYCT